MVRLLLGLLSLLALAGGAAAMVQWKRLADREVRRAERRAAREARAKSEKEASGAVATSEGAPPTPAPVGPPSATTEPVPGRVDDLTAIKGIGAVSAERLREAGVTSYAQVAAWSDHDVLIMAARIKVGADRITRQDWVGQARSLAAAARS
jgi:large subunit ribosomal protein L21